MAHAWLNQIESAMRTNQHEFRSWPSSSGRILIIPSNARLLGVALPGVEENLFWHDAAHQSAERISRILTAGPAGGDRLWIAPEAGFIFTNLDLVMTSPKQAGILPTEMDPGDWKIIEDEPGRIRLGAEMQLVDHRLKQVISLRISRQFSVIDPPPGLPSSIVSASFGIRNELTLLHGAAGMVAGIWDLLQIPPGGQMICPTVASVPSPRRYYEEWTAEHLRVDPNAIRFNIDGKKRLKFGLDPSQTTGRMGYHRTVCGVSTLILRWFSPQPGEPYIDVPYNHAGFVGGDAFQSYNDDGSNGGFGEMEYHDPGIIVGKTVHSRSGSCVTHVLAGPDAAIREAARSLLGVEL